MLIHHCRCKWWSCRWFETPHYNDVIKTTMASQITSLTFIHALIKENIKAPRHWPLRGEFTGTGEFPAQRSSNAENVSIWWRQMMRSIMSTIMNSPWLSSVSDWISSSFSKQGRPGRGEIQYSRSRLMTSHTAMTHSLLPSSLRATTRHPNTSNPGNRKEQRKSMTVFSCTHYTPTKW